MLCTHSCSDDNSQNSGNGHTGSNTIENQVTFTREDSTTLVMGADCAICCGVWEPGYNDAYAMKIFFYDPELWTNPSGAESFWKLFIVVNGINPGTTYSFPTTLESPFRLFFMDVQKGNELSGAEEESRGSITVEQLTCGPPLKITFSIDAIIGSEYSMGSEVRVTGTFNATVYSNPSSLFGCDFSM